MKDLDLLKDVTLQAQEREAIAQEMTLVLAIALKRLGGTITIPSSELLAAFHGGTPSIVSQRGPDGQSIVVSLLERT